MVQDFTVYSDNSLPVSKVIARHRGKLGQENEFQGLLIGLALHHLPCYRLATNLDFYPCTLLEQAL